MSDVVQTTEVQGAKEILGRLKGNIRQFIRGKDDVIDNVLVCLIAGGHVLIEDLPGVGKTTLAYCLARSIECTFNRIQFTTDLLPNDVTGVSIYDERQREFIFKPGPIFANIVLADEINRATPKTQSSLLEVMDRGKVSVESETKIAGEPFMVFATQNPVDYEGTFPLPESQLDRFLMRMQMGYPEHQSELEILRNGRLSYDSFPFEAVASRDEILAIQKLVPRVFVEDSVLEYLLKIVAATRTEAEFKAGVSVRGCLSLKLAAQSRAMLAGRDYVIPDDLNKVLVEVLVHRLSLRRPSPDTLEERRVVTTILRRILTSIPSPV
ncbi:MAG: MoxR family ATPase [Puniceicoccaceae bacterium]|nr:MAG: MoxR family ATPase [Puniceicoccaceae bacterium]